MEGPGIVFVTDEALYIFTRINSIDLSKVEQVESSRINSPLLNLKRFINIICRLSRSYEMFLQLPSMVFTEETSSLFEIQIDLEKY